MTFAYQKLALNEEENFTSTTCNRQGKWDPDPAEFCAVTLGKHIRGGAAGPAGPVLAGPLFGRIINYS